MEQKQQPKKQQLKATISSLVSHLSPHPPPPPPPPPPLFSLPVTSIWKSHAAYQASLAAAPPLPGTAFGPPDMAFFQGKLTLSSAKGL